MNFSDIFKKAFLEGYSGSVSSIQVVVSLSITCILALYIFFIYRMLTRKTFYSRNMNLSLAAISVITTSVILAVQSNIVLSLGMVGALSIVRFRTAIKDPMDLIFLFWSISVGIICGAGLAEIAVIMSIILTAGMFILDRIPVSKAPMMIVVNASNVNIEDSVIAIIKKYSRYYKVKSRNYTEQYIDLVIEVRLKEEKECIREIAVLSGITSANLLSHDGEVSF